MEYYYDFIDEANMTKGNLGINCSKLKVGFLQGLIREQILNQYFLSCVGDKTKFKKQSEGKVTMQRKI